MKKDLYLEHFFFFRTYHLTNELECLSLASLSSLVLSNTIAYWADSQVGRKCSVVNTVHGV
jgi:hypothetical protein